MTEYREFYDLISVEKALDLLADQTKQVQEEEQLPLAATLGRITAGEVCADQDIPGFARSTVDGFAVRAKDTFGASPSMPGLLTVIGSVGMGTVNPYRLQPGEAVQVPTGGMLPANADSVVMVEYVEQTASLLEVFQGVSPGENMVAPDEDLRQGEVILTQGHRLRPQDLGALAACGIATVQVYRQLHVGILSTGDEIVPLDTKNLKPGQVRDVNSYALAGHLAQLGCQVTMGGIIPDDFAKLLAATEELVQTCDLVLLSGGSSVGMRDHTVDVLGKIGPPGVIFHGITIKPGKPTLAGLAGTVPVIGLPGHPASALVVFKVLVEPVIRRLQGEQAYQSRIILRLPVTRNISSPAGREEYLRVKIDFQNGQYVADPILGKSGLVSTLLRGQALARIPLGSEGVKAGDSVDVLPWTEGEIR